MFHIMIVEDDENIREELALLLRNHGYRVSAVIQFDRIPSQVRELSPHLLLLDINLPGGEDGFRICTQLRSFSQIPIIFVTSRNTDMDELNSITLGGDDFITKPYNTSILLARVASLLKRAYPDSETESLSHKGVSLHLASGKLEYAGQSVELTKNEIKILHYLFLHKGAIVSRADIIEYLWDNEMFVDDNTLSVNITRIRGKLDSLGVEHFITTKRGQGYLI